MRRVAAGPLPAAPGAQCLGSHTFEYAILPHSGNWQQMYIYAYNYNVPLMARRADTHAGLELHEMNITRDDPSLVRKAEWPRGGPLPAHHSFVQIEHPALVLSAFYRSGDDLIVRCYNILREPVTSRVAFGFPVRAVERASLAEQTLEPLALDGGAVTIEVRGGETYTLKVIR